MHKIMHKKSYHKSGIDETSYSATAYEREKKLTRYKQLRAENCSEDTALEVLEISRATYYRWRKNYEILGLIGLEKESRRPHKIRKPRWTPEIENKVYKLRLEFKLWGKQKIAVMYKQRYGSMLSPSTVGRILKRLRAKEKIKSVAFYTGDYIPKPRQFNGHAQRIPADLRASQPGELVQIDHTTVRLYTGIHLKHFKAICPLTKFSAELVFRQATSNNAAKFLSFAQGRFPFPIHSIQVDGGSEFMAEFEEACQAKKIPLFVLPPRSPEQNGCVERSNRTVKAEFYSQYTGQSNLDHINTALQKFSNFYNHERPHQALQYLTPRQYYDHLFLGTLQSHMS